MQREDSVAGKSRTLQPPNYATVAVKSGGGQKRDKQTLDYVLRTGLAGGLAGCAVRLEAQHHIQ